MTIVESLKNFCVALGYGTSAADYEGENIETVLKELAVKYKSEEYKKNSNVKKGDIANMSNIRVSNSIY